MKDKITNNLKLKIFAVLFAAGLWMISININDPYQSKDYSVVVQMLNTNIMTSAGKYVEVVDRSDEITVRVRGNRSVMDNFTASNIVATADLSELDEENRVPIKLSTLKTSGSKIESIRSADTYVEVKVENVTRVQKKLEIITKNAPEDGYIVGKLSTEQTALRISGPESAVSQVDRAVVNFDLAGATEDVSMLLPVELYNAEGDKINDSRLTTSIEEVQCEAEILSTKEVALSYEVTGAAENGYVFTDEIISNPDTVRIAAKSSLLRGVKQIEITDILDIQNAKENVTAVFNVKDYLPENVILADSSYDGKVEVTAVVEETYTEEVAVGATQVQFLNVSEEIKAESYNEEAKYTVKVTALASKISEVLGEDIILKVDVSSYMQKNNITELKDGIYEMEALPELPQGVWSQDLVSVKVKISKVE